MPITINLLPQQDRFFLKPGYLWWWPVVFLVIAGMVLLFWHLVLQQNIADVGKDRGPLQQELNVITAKINNSAHLKQKEQVSSKQTTDYLVELERKRSNLVKVFTVLHQGVSGSLYFTRLEIKNNGVKIDGQVKAMTELKKLINKLAATKYSGSPPAIQKINKREDGYEFLLIWVYGGGN